ncbi:MAG: Gfo/Idh/MocA family oxidoreductase [Chloroflexi bacterium]|nr:Gfo/Idh/MocA family oxidoreductase [Chloroflexota bacterium]
MTTIKAGVIGAGFIGVAHVEALRRLGSVEVVAVAGSSLASAQRKAQELHVPQAYGDWRQLVADPDVQVVHNCTPNYLHRQVNLATIAAGKHVVAEKPLGVSSQETAEMLQAARQAGVVHAVNFNYRMYPLVQEARARLAAGDLGPVRLVHGNYLQDWLLLDTDYNWRIDPAVGGPSRAMADIGSHWCDLAQFVSGLLISEVCADITTFLPRRRRPRRAAETFAGVGQRPADFDELPIASEDYGSILLGFQGGARGACVISQVSAGHKNHLTLEVDGATGSLAWNQEEPNTLWLGHRGAPNQVLPKDPALLHPQAKPYAHYPGGHGEAYPDGIANLFRNVYRFIQAGGDPRHDAADFPTFVDGHRAALVVEAIMRSAQERRWVGLGEKDAD